jgi:hypothetical protein
MRWWPTRAARWRRRLPITLPGETVWQRLQSFASRVYGGPHGRGHALWTGSDGNFLGHNADGADEAPFATPAPGCRISRVRAPWAA